MEGITARYWREIPQRYRLEAGRCTSCGAIHYPPRSVCPECRGREMETTVLPDRGEVVTWTIIRTPPTEFTDLSPYGVALVKLANEVTIMCQLVDVDPEEISIGMPVKLEFRKIKADDAAGIIFYGHKAVPLRD